MSLVWSPPASDSLNGEFLGYVLTYRPVEAFAEDATNTININEDILRVQVNR